MGNVACWGTGALLDMSLRTNSGLLTNMDPASDWTDGGRPGLEFNGASNQRVPVTLTHPVSTNKCTISAWVKADSVANYKGIFVHRTPSLIGILLSGQSGNPLAYSWEVTTDEWNASSGLALTLNKWHFVCLCVSPTNARLYVDQNYWDNTKTHNAKSLDITWDIGQDTIRADRTWDGCIDDCRISDRTLSHAEVAELYKETRDGTYGSLALPSGPRLWPVEAAAAVDFPYNLYYGGTV